jgi:hypothetical protein
MQAPAYQIQVPLTPQSIAQAPIPQADADRKQAMKEAWKSYRGEFQAPLKVKANQPDDNVLTNRCSPIVNKGVSFLFGQVLKLECTDQEFLDGLWGNDDKKMTRLSKFAMNGGVCGQVFAKIIPAQKRMRYPRIVTLDPMLVRIITSPDDCELTLAYVIEYPGANGLQKRQIIARVDPDGMAEAYGEFDLDDTWTITNYARRGQTGVWLQTAPPETWPYPFAPIITGQNLPMPNEAWGIPDLTYDLIQMNKVLNFIKSNTSRILKFHGHPKTYATGVNASQINTAVDDVICLPSPDSKLANLEMHSDLHSSLAFISQLRDDMDEQSRVPAVALGRLEALPKGNISGVALQLLFQPLIEKTVQKQRLYGEFIRDISRAALVVSGKLAIEAYEDYTIDVHWQNLLPNDDLQAAQTSLIYEQLGVSIETLLMKLGFDPNDEAKKKTKEDMQKMVNYSRGVGLPPVPSQPQPGQPVQSPFMGSSNQGQQ